MEPFTVHEGIAAPLLRANIDTDAIIPSREMKRVSKRGLGEGLFAGWRYLEEGSRELNPDFVLNQPGYMGASVLLAGPNFGCGSSREHAVWALAEFGIRVVIAPDFGSIFANNCVHNGVLPLALDERVLTAIAEWVAPDPPTHRVTISLLEQTVSAGEVCREFSINSDARRMLLQGLDAVALTMEARSDIEAFHEQRRARYAWMYSSVS